MHHLTYDLGRPQGKKAYYPGRDAGNIVVRCTCGWAHSGSLFAVEERGESHLTAFRRELRRWNDPERKTSMPPAQGRWAEQAS